MYVYTLDDISRCLTERMEMIGYDRKLIELNCQGYNGNKVVVFSKMWMLCEYVTESIDNVMNDADITDVMWISDIV